MRDSVSRSVRDNRSSLASVQWWLQDDACISVYNRIIPSSDDARRQHDYVHVCMLLVPRHQRSMFDCRAFLLAGLTIWNSLPDSLRFWDPTRGFYWQFPVYCDNFYRIDSRHRSANSSIDVENRMKTDLCTHYRRTRQQTVLIFCDSCCDNCLCIVLWFINCFDCTSH